MFDKKLAFKVNTSTQWMVVYIDIKLIFYCSNADYINTMNRLGNKRV